MRSDNREEHETLGRLVARISGLFSPHLSLRITDAQQAKLEKDLKAILVEALREKA